MSAADKRISELLERWLTTLQVHASYLDLSNEDYARAQAWPPHQRPTRWIIDLARSRTTELKHMAEERQAAGDATFADALELMSFLTTLLGAEHVERFIPQAQPPKTAQSIRTATPAAKPATPAATAPTRLADAGTTDVPTIGAVMTAAQREPAATPPARMVTAARPSTRGRVIPAASGRNRTEDTDLRPALRGGAAKAAAPAGSRTRVTPAARTQNTGAQRTAARGSAAGRLSDKSVNQVIADAVRMLEWGREWPQLAGLIARLADRPSEKDIWRVLREHKATIESRAKLPPD